MRFGIKTGGAGFGWVIGDGVVEVGCCGWGRRNGGWVRGGIEVGVGIGVTGANWRLGVLGTAINLSGPSCLRLCLLADSKEDCTSSSSKDSCFVYFRSVLFFKDLYFFIRINMSVSVTISIIISHIINK